MASKDQFFFFTLMVSFCRLTFIMKMLYIRIDFAYPCVCTICTNATQSNRIASNSMVKKSSRCKYSEVFSSFHLFYFSLSSLHCFLSFCPHSITVHMKIKQQQIIKKLVFLNACKYLFCTAIFQQYLLCQDRPNTSTQRTTEQLSLHMCIFSVQSIYLCS